MDQPTTERALAQSHIATTGPLLVGTPDLQEVSASSSFLRLILSFNPSASRRAVAILVCIASPDISDDILQLQGPLVKCGDENTDTYR